MKKWTKYVEANVVGRADIGVAYYFPAESFIAFLVGWLFLIPAAFVVYMVYRFWGYMNDWKNRIGVDQEAALKNQNSRNRGLKACLLQNT